MPKTTPPATDATRRKRERATAAKRVPNPQVNVPVAPAPSSVPPAPPPAMPPVAPASSTAVPAVRTADHSADQTLKTLTGLDLPDTLQVNLPNFQNLLNPSDISSPAAFESAGWQRITDEQREQDQRAYKELNNYAQNLGDGIKTLTTMVTAATAATKLGRSLVQYAIGRQEVSTELVNFQLAQRGTAKAQMKLHEADRELQHLGQLAQQKELSYQADLDDLAAKLDRKLRQIETTKFETQQQFPLLQAQVQPTPVR